MIIGSHAQSRLKTRYNIEKNSFLAEYRKAILNKNYYTKKDGEKEDTSILIFSSDRKTLRKVIISNTTGFMATILHVQSKDIKEAIDKKILD
jgi:hypothetical protein